MVDKEFSIRNNETEEEYIMRACELGLTLGLTWREIANIINEETERNSDESTYRRRYKAYSMGVKAGREKREPEQISIPIDDIPKIEDVEEDTEDERISKLLFAKIESEKERWKLSDERVQINAMIRRLAREETIKEIGIRAAERMNEKKMLEPSVCRINNGENSGILQISDWHLGIEFANYLNSYNIDEAKNRIKTLRDKTIALCRFHDISKLIVVNLSDLIAGRIHLQIRLQSRIDVIDQTMLAAELLSELLFDLNDAGLEIHYYDCLDNHSRVEPNKKESMQLESLARMIPWYLKVRVGNFVKIHDNVLGPDIITFKEKGYNILGVHGDKDEPTNIVRKMSTMTHEYYDLMLTAHLHHFSADEQNETLILSNGSLMGTDEYAFDKRLSSKASQNFIVVTDKCVAEAIYRIVLN